MHTSRLNTSIYIIWTFILLVILQHIAVIVDGEDSLINRLFVSFLLFIAIIFWIQFYFNFKNYLKIDDIRTSIISILITDAVLLLIYVFYTYDSIHPVSGIDKTTNVVLEGMGLIARIVLLIYNMQLGLKFYHEKNSPEVRHLGLSLILRMIATIGTAYFKTNAILKPIYHVFILFEILPWWYTYIVYRKIMISENIQ